MSISSHIDHLVIAAETLAQGVAWCEATLGVTPEAGGEHPLMGTHNRVLRITTPAFPRAYLEIIAINADAREPGRRRWFDLDDPDLRAGIRQEPRLVHFIADCNRAGDAIHVLAELGIDRGKLLQAERPTPAGLLRWQISVRNDGQRLFQGMLPTLIAWGDVHPADSLPESPLSLLSMTATHPRPDDLHAAYAAISLQQVTVRAGLPNFSASLMTPRGEVTLESKGL